MEAINPEKNFKKREAELLAEISSLQGQVKNFCEVLPSPFCIVNGDFIILETGQDMLDLFGYNKEEIIGQPLMRLFQTARSFEGLRQKLQNSQKLINEEVVLLGKVGRTMDVLLSAVARPGETGGEIRRIFSFQDITLRRKTEKELQEKVDRLRQYTKELENTRRALLNILEDAGRERERAENERDRTSIIIRNFADGLILLEDRKIALFNPKAAEFFQTAEEEAIGQTIDDLSDHPRFGPLLRLLAEERDFLRQEIVLPERFTLEVSSMKALKEGQTIGRMVILHNITREKMIEQMKTEFVSIAAHQLRTPISALKWIIKMLLDEDLGALNKDQQNYLNKAYQSNERMIKLVNDLLNVTRIEEGRFLYNITKENFADLIAKAMAPFKTIAENKGLVLDFEKPKGRLPAIYLDGEKLTLAIQNLVDNAIHYTVEGAVRIKLGYLSDKKEFLCQVIDSGIGIPIDQQPRVFSRFFRAANAIKVETSGTGLGLFIAKNIIEAHGGKIWFESKENKGTAFSFTIPTKEVFDTFLKEF